MKTVRLILKAKQSQKLGQQFCMLYLSVMLITRGEVAVRTPVLGIFMVLLL